MTLADLQFSSSGGAVIARLTGEIDLSNADSLAQALSNRVSNEAHALILDLSDADYLDSSAIQLIYRLRERLRARGQTLKLVVPDASPAEHALRLAGVMRHLETLDSVDVALRSVA